MIKCLFLLLIHISFSAAASAGACEIHLYKNIIQIHNSLDNSIIKSSNCSQEVINNFISYASRLNGKIPAANIEKILMDESMSIKLKPSIFNIRKLKELLQDKYGNDQLNVSSAKSIYPHAAISMDTHYNLDLQCKNCNKGGDKNIKFEIKNKTYWISAKFTQKAIAYIPKSNLHISTPILQKSDFKKVILNKGGARNYFTNLENIQFFKLNKNLNPNNALKATDLSPKRLVNYGQKVKVKFQNKSVNLTTSAIARKNGNWGDYIELENIKSKKKIIGKVINFNTVVVEL